MTKDTLKKEIQEEFDNLIFEDISHDADCSSYEWCSCDMKRIKGLINNAIDQARKEERENTIAKIDELINRWDGLAVIENQDKVIYEDMASWKKLLASLKDK